MVLLLFFGGGDTVGGGVTSCRDGETQEGKDADVIIFVSFVFFFFIVVVHGVIGVIQWALKSNY